jgi:hypothetical protein
MNYTYVCRQTNNLIILSKIFFQIRAFFFLGKSQDGIHENSK